MPYQRILEKVGVETQQLEFLLAILNNLPVGIVCKDAEDDMRIVLFSSSAEKIFGITADQAIGKTAKDLISDEMATLCTSDECRSIQTWETVYAPERLMQNAKTGEDVWYSTWKVPVKTKQGNLVICISQDITETKRAEIENRKQERQLQNISTNAPGLLYQFKVENERKFSFTFFSSKAYEVIGVRTEEILQDAASVINLIHQDDRASFEESLSNTIKNFTPWHWEGRVHTRNNGLRWFQGSSTPSLHEDGVSLLWDGILMDVTSQKEIEEKLRSQEAQLASTSKLVALGEMAGGVAHEINTPLNAILFCAEQIQTSLKENSVDELELIETSQLIADTAQRIAKIVRGLKAFARDGSAELPEETDIGVVVEQVLSLCGQRMLQSGVKLTLEQSSDPIMVTCRAVQLGQVILNLLNNSFDAVVNKESPWIKIQIRSNQKSVFIEITDSGLGLSSDVKRKLFQPFFTTKELGKGTGLGLSISRGIMEAHKGKLFVDEDSANTKFVIELPSNSELKIAV